MYVINIIGMLIVLNTHHPYKKILYFAILLMFLFIFMGATLDKI